MLSAQVLLDVNLPDGNGFELCRTIKQVHPELPVIFLTRLAREKPGLYAKLASKDGGLQGYVDAMGSLIKFPHRLWAVYCVKHVCNK